MGPRPAGSRLVAVVFDGAEVVGDCDVTIRRGDELILVESPAPMDEQTRIECLRACSLLGAILAQGLVAVLPWPPMDLGFCTR